MGTRRDSRDRKIARGIKEIGIQEGRYIRESDDRELVEGE
jgi:hypothetical protein